MNEPLLTSTLQLRRGIDRCITNLVDARRYRDGRDQEVLFNMESLMVAALQQFDCIIDYLEKEEREERSNLVKDVQCVFEEAERRQNGYHILPFLSENGDLTDLRTSYDQVVSYADDMRYMLDDIKELVDSCNDLQEENK